MGKKRRSGNQSGGVNIEGSDVWVGGDITGRDKITTTGVSGAELVELSKAFSSIRGQIERRPADPNVDKGELKDLVERIEQEVKKGEQANPKKVERWLAFLADMADDIFQVTVAALSHPVAGVAKAIQLIAQQARKKYAR